MDISNKAKLLSLKQNSFGDSEYYILCRDLNAVSI